MLKFQEVLLKRVLMMLHSASFMEPGLFKMYILNFLFYLTKT